MKYRMGLLKDLCVEYSLLLRDYRIGVAIMYCCSIIERGSLLLRKCRIGLSNVERLKHNVGQTSELYFPP